MSTDTAPAVTMRSTNTVRSAAADRIIEAADAAGWAVERFEHSLRLRRRGTDVFVEWNVRGGVTYASTTSRRFDGRDKAQRVIEYLRT